MSQPPAEPPLAPQALRIFRAALAAVEPGGLIEGHAASVEQALDRTRAERLLVVSVGKAGYPMAEALCRLFGDRIRGGFALVKDGHGGDPGSIAPLELIEASHPVPDARGAAAARRIIERLKRSGPEELVLMPIAGGGSALLVAPAEPLTLEQKQETTRALLRAGADIEQLNAVRKHLSAVKGGRLAACAHPAPVLSLIVSDVIGDRLDVIASGPTAPDPTTYADALDVLRKLRLSDRVPPAVISHLKRGIEGLVEETPKPGDPLFDEVENLIVGSNALALDAAEEEAASAGWPVERGSAELRGEARLAAEDLARRAISRRFDRACLLSGGETTVRVRGDGLGGRNMELALAFALEIEGERGITLLSAGTDGTDGPTDAAGAVVDGETVSRGRRAGVDALAMLERNDSYRFFESAGGLLKTGPTGTNVMDLQILLLEGR